MKTTLDIKNEQKQKIALTPEMIQGITILQCDKYELAEYVQEELLSNPVLEMKESNNNNADEESHSNWEKYAQKKKDEISSEKKYGDVNESVNYIEALATKELSLSDFLISQLRMLDIDNKVFETGKYIIDLLDENGYLNESVEEISKRIKKPESEINEIIEIIQSFEPVGVCARNVKECLIIQLRSKGQSSPEKEILINDYLEEIASNKLEKAAKDLKISQKEIQAMFDEIKTLNPKPAINYSDINNVIPVEPDVVVCKEQDDYKVKLCNDSTPELYLSSYYRTMMNEIQNNSEVSEYLNDRFRKAEWLIKKIEQRKNTIKKVAESVIKHQEMFLEYGKKALKPLKLKDIADEIGVHESTVSRAVKGKYIQCDRGIFEMSYFFCSDTGGIATVSLKEMIRDMISKEEPSHPLSDQKIAELLNEKGLDVARRTVAKYRTELNIQSSSKRKRY